LFGHGGGVVRIPGSEVIDPKLGPSFTPAAAAGVEVEVEVSADEPLPELPQPGSPTIATTARRTAHARSSRCIS
jgi:hypothetical protein